MKFVGIVLLCCVLLAKGQSSDSSKDDPTTTTSTEAPPPTPPPTTPTTKKTTTPEPTPTTPTTTTTAGTTTAKPAPAPVPDYPKNVGKWSAENQNNSACIVLKGAIQLIVNHENKTEAVNVPPHAVGNGDCTGPQVLVLTWDSLIPGKQNSLSLTFEENATKANSLDAPNGITVGKYGLHDVAAILYLNSTNATHGSVENIAAFQTPLNHSYSCLAEEVLKSKNADFTLKIQGVQLEAYRVSPPGHPEFSTAIQCPADDATDVVPIAVGAALAGLVVIVLIAYLIGRKRSRARGYQSV